MNRQKTYYLSLAIILAVVAVIFWQTKKSQKLVIPQLEIEKTQAIGVEATYYCSFGNSSCSDLDLYFSENNIDRNVSITKIDIIKNPKAEKEMDLQASGCGLKNNEYGTPFLFFKGKCYVGSEEIKTFFKNNAAKF